MNKFDSLKPLLKLMESILVSHGQPQNHADLVVLDIAERLVTAGYGWDKIIQYQSKVRPNIIYHNILQHEDNCCFRESMFSARSSSLIFTCQKTICLTLLLVMTCWRGCSNILMIGNRSCMT